MSTMSINADQRLFVLSHGDGYSCLGFDVVFKRLKQYAALLHRAPPSPTEIGTADQYHQYKVAERAYIETKPTETLFDPETPAQVRKILEDYRKSEKTIRVFLGGPQTGRDWMDEWDTIGRISRSMGPLRVPILVPAGESGGGAILTECIVRMMDVKSGKDIYRHPTYYQLEMAVIPSDVEGYFETVTVGGKVHARFKRPGQAQKWIEFMSGQRMRS